MYKKNILFILFACSMNFTYPGKIPKHSAPEIITQSKLPIVYSPDYNFNLFYIEKVHPFDAKKFQRIHHYLINTVGINPQRFYCPQPVSMQDLAIVHTPEYLKAIEETDTSNMVAGIIGVPINWLLWNSIVQSRILHPMKMATGGTLLGAQLALEHGWAINLGGGFHHAKGKGLTQELNTNPNQPAFDEGDGFCIYGDIQLAIEKMWRKDPTKKVMIVDLDAHQGNGHEGYFLKEVTQTNGQSRIAIFDMYSAFNYPSDNHAKRAITYDIPLETNTSDAQYLHLLESYLPIAIAQFKPDFILYNAGTDIFEKDPLGRLKISEQGIITRDAFVFAQALIHNIPILMVLSGGYTKESAGIIGKSIENILKNVLKVK